jgi:hypothetical protein
MKQFKLLLFFFVASALLFSGCRKDEILDDPSAKLEFSTDSVTFDTVFTTVGSTTKLFKIYNVHSQPLNISRIALATGSSSQFRINVDGVSAVSHTDVELLANDSLFIFVQVTVNPLNSNSPLLIRDSIIFETNGNIQDVNLIAIGQDVYLHRPDHFPTNGFPDYSIIGCNEVWTNDKPHLIFGYAVVDSGCKLTMNPGTRVHLHNGAVLWVYQDGSLEINGMKGSEVVIQGDRLEQAYKDVPGQWGKIWMMKGSKDNSINYAIIKNGSIGIQVDSGFASPNYTLKLSNTIVKNMLAAGIYGQGAHMWSSNCVFANCGQYVAALTLGGSYKFEHCTFANYYNFNTGGSTSSGSRSTPLLIMNNYYIDVANTLQIRDMDSCYFGNCILYGDLDEEIGMDTSTLAPGGFSYEFDHSLIKTTRSTPSGSHYNVAYKNVDPGFKDISANDYQLKVTSSNSIDKGETSIFVGFDLNNQPRPNPTTSIPDLGAYEFY